MSVANPLSPSLVQPVGVGATAIETTPDCPLQDFAAGIPLADRRRAFRRRQRIADLREWLGLLTVAAVGIALIAIAVFGFAGH